MQSLSYLWYNLCKQLTPVLGCQFACLFIFFSVWNSLSHLLISCISRNPKYFRRAKLRLKAIIKRFCMYIVRYLPPIHPPPPPPPNPSDDALYRWVPVMQCDAGAKQRNCSPLKKIFPSKEQKFPPFNSCIFAKFCCGQVDDWEI